MANLSAYISLIEKARRGEDVRDSIINAIHAIIEEGVNAASLNGYPASDFILKTDYFSNIFFDQVPIKSSRKAVTSDGLYYCLIQANYVIDDINGEEIEEYADEGILVSTITINGKDELLVGESTQLLVDILPTDASNKRVTWESSDVNVATVNRLGLVRAISQGYATITAYARDSSRLSKNFPLNVRELIKTTSITITTDAGNSPRLYFNSPNIHAYATFTPADTDDVSVIWYSSDKFIVNIDQNGEVSLMTTAGTAYIYCVANDGSNIESNRLPITVIPEFGVESVTIASDLSTIYNNVGARLSVNLLPTSTTIINDYEIIFSDTEHFELYNNQFLMIYNYEDYEYGNYTNPMDTYNVEIYAIVNNGLNGAIESNRILLTGIKQNVIENLVYVYFHNESYYSISEDSFEYPDLDDMNFIFDYMVEPEDVYDDSIRWVLVSQSPYSGFDLGNPITNFTSNGSFTIVAPGEFSVEARSNDRNVVVYSNTYSIDPLFAEYVYLTVENTYEDYIYVGKNSEVVINVELYPYNAMDREIFWSVYDPSGESDFVYDHTYTGKEFHITLSYIPSNDYIQIYAYTNNWKGMISSNTLRLIPIAASEITISLENLLAEDDDFYDDYYPVGEYSGEIVINATLNPYNAMDREIFWSVYDSSGESNLFYDPTYTGKKFRITANHIPSSDYVEIYAYINNWYGISSNSIKLTAIQANKIVISIPSMPVAEDGYYYVNSDIIIHAELTPQNAIDKKITWNIYDRSGESIIYNEYDYRELTWDIHDASGRKAYFVSGKNFHINPMHIPNGYYVEIFASVDNFYYGTVFSNSIYIYK